MDSTNAMPLAAGASPREPARAHWRWLRQAWVGSAMRRGGSRPDRAMRLDPWRLAAAGSLAVALAATASWFWTRHEHRQQAELAAQSALAFLDRRLNAIDVELAQMARHAGRAGALDQCPQALVDMLVEQSLQSALVRRFDLLQVGSTHRCEPGGARHGPPLEAVPAAGLSIVPGSPLNARPVVQRPLGDAIVLQATLDPNALALPRAALGGGLNNLPMRIEAQSPPAGVLLIRDTRPRPGTTGPALTTSARSSLHNVGVQVQIDQGDLDAAFRRLALASGGIAGLLVAGLAAWTWRQALRRARLLHRLRRALRKRQFEPFVQPIVDLETGRCVGAEVLMRWKHPQRGILAPAEFIDEAERSGLIVAMSDLVMTRAAHRLAPIALKRPDLYFSFNVTPTQLRQPDFGRRLGELFREDTLAPARVLLELTEREFVDADTQQALAALRRRGWRMAVDDFGTGHSSLASLEKLAIDRIKIDRAFVRTIDERTVQRPVLDAIIALAGQIGVPLIAEGVETRSQWDYLAARGVRHAQGFLMARPMSIEAFAAWLAEPAQAPVEAEARAVVAPAAADAGVLALWEQMDMPGGLDQRDRMYRLQTYRQCFVGREAVDWIAQRLSLSRAEAVRIGQRLLALDLIRHVVEEHDFKDADYFYRIVRPSAQIADGAPAVQDLRQALKGDGGLALGDHKRGLIVQAGCARGSDIVDWIVGRYDVSRSTACKWASQRMRAGALRHFYDDRPFGDDSNLFRPV